LGFETAEVSDPQLGNFPLRVIRLMTNVCFRRPDGSFSEAFEAVVDTGAFVSVLPRNIWREIKREIKVADASFGGISERKQCQIKCSIGTVTCFLTDERGNRSHDYNIVAFLAKTDKVPLIIGFADLLEKMRTCFRYQIGEAWIED
jgi:hypothetical protein